MKRLVALAAAPLVAMSLWGAAPAQGAGPDTGSSNGLLMELWGISPEVQNDPVKFGGKLVEHLGCLYCHGLGGRQGIENPNAVRKHVPSWDSPEFVRRYPVDDGVRYVIEKGRVPKKDPKAKGSPVPMPPWGNRLNKDELDAIVAYIWSLRNTPVSTHEKGGRGNTD